MLIAQRSTITCVHGTYKNANQFYWIMRYEKLAQFDIYLNIFQAWIPIIWNRIWFVYGLAVSNRCNLVGFTTLTKSISMHATIFDLICTCVPHTCEWTKQQQHCIRSDHAAPAAAASERRNNVFSLDGTFSKEVVTHIKWLYACTD